jgi:hypothetical protein
MGITFIFVAIKGYMAPPPFFEDCTFSIIRQIKSASHFQMKTTLK